MTKEEARQIITEGQKKAEGLYIHSLIKDKRVKELERYMDALVFERVTSIVRQLNST